MIGYMHGHAYSVNLFGHCRCTMYKTPNKVCMYVCMYVCYGYFVLHNSRPCEKESLNLTGHTFVLFLWVRYFHGVSALIHPYDFWYQQIFRVPWNGVNELFQKHFIYPSHRGFSSLNSPISGNSTLGSFFPDHHCLSLFYWIVRRQWARAIWSLMHYC